MEILSTMSTKAKWALMTQMKKLSLWDFEGKDIDALSIIILSIFKQLKMLNLVPEDMPQIVISIFKTCFVKPFQCLFLPLDNHMRILGKQLTPEDICSIADQNYRLMKLAGDWDSMLAKAMLSEKKGSGLEPEKEPKGGK
eukprot:8467757-Ditylum_brightwellii.AAC.1